MSHSMFGIAVLFVTFSGTYAKSAEYIMNVEPTEIQSSRFEDGIELIDNLGDNSIVRILEPRTKMPRQGGFRVYVINNSANSFNFGPENVMIVLPEGKTVGMFSFQELLKQKEKREMWQSIAVGLSAAGRNIEASQAGTTYGTSTYTSSSSGSYGTTPYTQDTTGRATYSGYNSGAAIIAQSVAQDQNNKELQQMQLFQDSQRQELMQVMKTTTIDPGKSFGGIVQYKIPSLVRSSKVPIPILIKVAAGSEVHVFRATLSKAK